MKKNKLKKQQKSIPSNGLTIRTNISAATTETFTSMDSQTVCTGWPTACAGSHGMKY